MQSVIRMRPVVGKIRLVSDPGSVAHLRKLKEVLYFCAKGDVAPLGSQSQLVAVRN